MYYFNKLLFKTIGIVLCKTQQQLADEAGVSKAAWRKWNDTLNPTMSSLVQLCNAEHVSISHFIVADPTLHNIGKMTDYVMPSSTWVDIAFRPTDMGDALTVGASRTIDDACKLINVSRQKFYRHFREGGMKKDSLHVVDFINVCNLATLYPGDFIIDMNREIPLADGFTNNADAVVQLGIARKRIQELQAENARLRSLLQRSLSQQGLTLYSIVAENDVYDK